MATYSYEKKIEREYSADVVVVGGGVAGCAAALAAARGGADVVLLERDGVLGGTAGAGLVTPIASVSSDTGKPFGGIVTELCGKFAELSGYCRRPSETGKTSRVSVPHIAKYVLLKTLSEAKVRIHFHTALLDAVREDDRLTAVIAHDKSGLAIYHAKEFIDATGDADLTFAAGEETVLGSEPGVYEELASTGLAKVHYSDKSADYSNHSHNGLLQPVSVFFTMGGVDFAKASAFNNKMITYDTFGLTREEFAKLPYAGECGFEPDESDRLPLPQGRVLVFPGVRSDMAVINMSRVLGINGADADSLSEGEYKGQMQVMNLVDFLRRFVPGFEDSYLIESASSLGVRESRRLRGRAVLGGRDLIECRRFPDAVARGNYIIDIHDPAGKSKAIGGKIHGPFYEIPYGALTPKTVKNLLVCGRCISADHVAHSATRIQGSCITTGQAAGTAAAIAAANGSDTASVSIEALRKKLSDDGVWLD